jgi:hypothetical protein
MLGGGVNLCKMFSVVEASHLKISIFFPGQCIVYLKLFVSFLSPSMQMRERYLNQVTTASSKIFSSSLFTNKPNIWRYTRSLKY